MLNLCDSDGSYPTVTSHSGEWSLDSSSHSISWTIPMISFHDESQSGSLVFSVGGDDTGAFFPVLVNFTAKGSLAGIEVASVTHVEGGDEAVFSVDSYITTEEFLVV